MNPKSALPVWQMVKAAVDALGGTTSNAAVRDWVLKKYPGTNNGTINCQTNICTVNQPCRTGYKQNKQPRLATGRYDFLYKTARGQLEWYLPAKHGQWAIVRDSRGRLVVQKLDVMPKQVPPKNVWIFQAVPEDYDLVTEVPKRRSQGDSWRVTRFRGEMQKNDLLLYWRSGQEAGIYCTGWISEPAYRVGKRWRVDVKFNPLLESPIYRDTLLRHPTLKGLSILRCARGTNFEVKPAEWHELKRLLADRHHDGTSEFEQAQKETKPFNPANRNDGRKHILASIVARQGQGKFRQDLLRNYRRKCLISRCDAEKALEAAHICSFRGKHTNNAENGLLLRSDLHTLFDLHLLSIDASQKRVLVAPELEGTYYAKFKGRPLHFPRKGPSKDALDLHRAAFERKNRIH